jgi:hypothetical protein
MRVRNVSLALVLLLGAVVAPAIAQVPVQEKIHFTVSTPFQLKGNNTILPAGDYLLFQVKPNDRHLFALYQGDMTHSPVAMVHAVRIYYSLGRLPGKARMLLETDETSPQNYMVLEGWNVPGDYGWRVIGVTPRSELLNSRLKVRK